MHAKNSHGGGHDSRTNYQAEQAEHGQAAEHTDKKQQFIELRAIAQ